MGTPQQRRNSAVASLQNPLAPARPIGEHESAIAREYLGGDLVLGEVHLDGEFQEYHYWNRVDGADLDLTESQFGKAEVITEKDTLASDFRANYQEGMRPEVRARIDAFRRLVDHELEVS